VSGSSREARTLIQHARAKIAQSSTTENLYIKGIAICDKMGSWEDGTTRAITKEALNTSTENEKEA
jgi:hypothetical protein